MRAAWVLTLLLLTAGGVRAETIPSLSGVLHGARSRPAEIDPRTGRLAIDRGAPFAALGGVRGTVVWSALGGDDVRVGPAQLVLDVGDGALTAVTAAPPVLHASRRVDPASGRPLEPGAPGAATCATGAEAACWTPGEPEPGVAVFEALCAATLGTSRFAWDACELEVWNSLRNPLAGGLGGPFPIEWAKQQTTWAALFANVIGGASGGAVSIVAFLATVAPTAVPFAPIRIDPCDAFATDGCEAKGQMGVPDLGPHVNFASGVSLNEGLTDEQQALLGCGALWGSDCEATGIELRRSEASVLLQAFGSGVLTDGAPVAGTLGARGPLPALRPSASGTIQIAGARGPLLPLDGTPPDPRHDDRVDGSTSGIGVPPEMEASAGQVFVSELAAVSFDLQMFLAAFSTAPAVTTLNPDRPPALSEFDYLEPYDTTPGQCSWAQPHECELVRNLRSYAVTLLDEDPRGVPARRWLWETGTEFTVTSATGTLASMLGGTAHALGPEASRLGEGIGVPIVLVPAGGAELDAASGLRVAGADGEAGTEDDPNVGVAYGVVSVPEPAGLAGAALLALAALRGAARGAASESRGGTAGIEGARRRRGERPNVS